MSLSNFEDELSFTIITSFSFSPVSRVTLWLMSIESSFISSTVAGELLFIFRILPCVYFCVSRTQIISDELIERGGLMSRLLFPGVRQTIFCFHC